MKLLTYLICFAFILIAFYVPLFKFNFDVASVLTVISLLFAILVGFFIAAATSNYMALQSLIAEEDAGLIAVYNYVNVIAPGMVHKIVDAIDKYTIAALSFELVEYISQTTREFNNISKAVEEVDFKDGRGEQLIQSLYSKKNDLYRTRQNIALVARSIVTKSHWFVLGSLMILIDLLVLAIRDGSFVSSLTTGILFIVTFLTLLLLRDIDTNRFLEQALSYQNSQQVFEVIGKPRYFAEVVIKAGRIDHPQGIYRTGYYNSPSDNEIRLVDEATKS